MTRPVVSIVTAVKNGETFLRQTVDSVLSQTGDFDLEYIIRDGLSTDGTLAILAEYGDRLTVVSERDGSPQAAINAGLDMAKGDILAWLNADDVYHPGTLQAVVEAFRRHPHRSWCYGFCNIMDETGAEIRRPITWYKTTLGWFYSRHLLLCENYVNQPATFWRRDLWQQVKRLDGGFKAAWDYQLWLEMAGRSRAISIHRLLATFRRHGASISETSFERQFAEELTIARKYGTFLHGWIHWFNCWKIITIYRLLNRRAAARRQSGQEA